MKRSIHVSIQGLEYALKTDLPEAKVEQIESFVNGQIDQVARADASGDSYRAVVLALLNVAGSYLHGSSSSGSGDSAAVAPGQEQRLEQLVERLEDALRDPQGSLNF